MKYGREKMLLSHVSVLHGQLRRSVSSLEASMEASEMDVYVRGSQRPFEEGLLGHQVHLRQVSEWFGLRDVGTVLL